MSILIKGMEMPKSCVDCPMFDWDLEYLKCKANDKYFKANGEWRKVIEPTCPLIEVPEDVQPVGHGEWTAEGNDEIGNYWDECTACSKAVWFPPFVKNDYKYCPHCGTRMDGDDNG